MDRIRIGVIGLGFGLQHVRTLVNMPEAHLVAVADRNSAHSGEAVAAQYGARAYRDGVEMLENEALDAVSICTAPHRREELVECAARNGVAMFVEKPWAFDVPHAQKLADICRAHDATVMTGFSFRFHPAVGKLRTLMDADLGAGWLLSGEYVFGWIPAADGWLWKPEGGGGFFNENSCHLLDVICHLLGEPVSVMAEAGAPQNTPSPNAGAVVIRFANQAMASLILGGVGTPSWREYPRLHLLTEKGEAELLGRQHTWERLRWTRRDNAELHDLVSPPETLSDTRYSHAFRHFFACLRNGQKPTATLEDGIRSVALAMAIYESAHTGGRVLINRSVSS
jgi:predicted dehydrogenase